MPSTAVRVHTPPAITEEARTADRARVVDHPVMTHYDVFNGDADGLCSLHQLRLEHPLDSILVTGPKRDIELLGRVDAEGGDAVTVLDVSIAANRTALTALLERGVTVQYFDHHFAGELPLHAGLQAMIDTSPQVCTGILVDRYLQGKQRVWAVVAAFGDDLQLQATALGSSLDLDPRQLAALRQLGEGLAYNAYGDSLDDLIVPPADLYRTLARYPDPFRLLQSEPLFAHIDAIRREDLALACAVEPDVALENARVYVLPDAAWSRRVRGALGNHLANGFPDLAHAILTVNKQGDYTVSVRAPRSKPTGADALCCEFPTGGGRAGAAGINHLPRQRLAEFARRLREAFP